VGVVACELSTILSSHDTKKQIETASFFYPVAGFQTPATISWHKKMTVVESLIVKDDSTSGEFRSTKGF
jgi:hypothetical protein